MKQLDMVWREAKTANESKSDFLANMSHEIRTPMASILGFAEIIEDRSLTYEEPAEFVEEGHPSPIVARTTNAISEERDRCLEMGCVDFCSKPVNRRELLATIKRHTQN